MLVCTESVVESNNGVNVNKSSFVRDLSVGVAVTALLVSKWCGAAELGFHPTAETAPGNPPSAARAQAAKYNVPMTPVTTGGISSHSHVRTSPFAVPGGCVTSFTVRNDGAILRHTSCEYSSAQIQRLATTGR